MSPAVFRPLQDEADAWRCMSFFRRFAVLVRDPAELLDRSRPPELFSAWYRETDPVSNVFSQADVLFGGIPQKGDLPGCLATGVKLGHGASVDQGMA